jgi:putative transposase
MRGWCADCSMPRPSSPSKKSGSLAGSAAGDIRQRRRIMIAAVVALAPAPGLTASACAALNLSRASVYRHRWHLARPQAMRRPQTEAASRSGRHRTPNCAGSSARAALRRPDASRDLRLPARRRRLPLLDPHHVPHSGRQQGSPGAAKQLRHPVYKKSELLAQAPNEVWSWDITKLMGPAKWSYFYLYVIIDIFSRRVVGWCVVDRESATLFAPYSRTPPPNIPRRRANSPCMPIAAVRCEPRPRRCCLPISASPNPTAGRTPPMTIRSRKATSKP